MILLAALAPVQPEDITDEDKMMQELMGFNGFDTTKVLVRIILIFVFPLPKNSVGRCLMPW